MGKKRKKDRKTIRHKGAGREEKTTAAEKKGYALWQPLGSLAYPTDRTVSDPHDEKELNGLDLDPDEITVMEEYAEGNWNTLGDYDGEDEDKESPLGNLGNDPLGDYDALCRDEADTLAEMKGTGVTYKETEARSLTPEEMAALLGDPNALNQIAEEIASDPDTHRAVMSGRVQTVDTDDAPVIDMRGRIVKAIVHVPDVILRVMDDLLPFAGGNEYGILIKSERIEVKESHNGVIVAEVWVSEEWILPRQEVTPAHFRVIDAKQNDLRFDVVIHRHPPAVRSFSGEDEEILTPAYTVSLLYMPGEGFVDAVMTFKYQGIYFRVKPDVKVERKRRPDPRLRELFRERVQVERPAYRGYYPFTKKTSKHDRGSSSWGIWPKRKW